MIRKPLQLVDSNVQKSSVPIFDDFKSASKANVSHSAKKASLADQSQGQSKLLVAMFMVQQKELRKAHMRAAFLKLANNLLAHRAIENSSSNMISTGSKPSNTPKKRRFEENGFTEVDDEGRVVTHNTSTPPRSRSNTLHSTPYSSKRTAHTSNHNRAAFSTPGRAPLGDATNRENNPSVYPEKRGQKDAAASPRKPTESLSDRLRQVEDSLQKLQVLGDLENVRAAAAQLKSPIRNRIYSALHSNSSDSVPPTNENQSQSSNRTTSPVHRPAPSAAPSTHAHPATGPNVGPKEGFVGTGSTLLRPQLAEHQVLQATIQRATKASMKTLLRKREALPGATEARDQLAAYQQDSAKIATALKPVDPNPAGEAASQVALLETSIAHYHHASSALYPLTPLGDQSIRGDAFSPVPLSEMSILKDKMQSWRSKYAPKATTAPPS